MNLKKTPTLLATCLLLGAGVTGSVRAGFAEISQEFLNADGDHILTLAHRGDWRAFPENSLSSIQSCIDNGVESVEIDIRKTSDGVMVLMHDSTVNRTTNGSGSVSGMTLAQIKALRLKFNGTVTDEQVPTLEEAMLLAKDHCMIYLDKTYPSTIADSMAVLEQTGTVPNAIFRATGSAQSVLDTFAAAGIDLDDINIMFKITCSGTTSPTLSTIMSELAILEPEALQVNYNDAGHPVLAAANVSTIRQQGTRVFVNTMHDGRVHRDPNPGQEPDDWDWCAGRGINMIQTDRPLWLADYAAGRIFDASPEDSTTGVASNPTLTWMRGLGATAYDVYFGTDSTAVGNATTSAPEFMGNQAEPDRDYSPGPLAPSTTYYWRVDQVTLSGTIAGEVVEFTTGIFVPPYTGTLPVHSGLVIHLDAGEISGLSENAPVSVWQDQSGKGNDATQGAMGIGLPTYSASVINSRPVVRFDGVNDSLRANLATPVPVNNVTLFAVGAGSGKYLFTTQGPGPADNRLRLVQNDGKFGCRVGEDGYAYGSPSIPGDGNPHVRALVSGAPAYRMYQDGALQLTGSQTSGLVAQGVNLAAYWDMVDPVKEWSAYDLAELLVYDRALSPTEIALVNGHLTQKYAVSNTTDSDGDGMSSAWETSNGLDPNDGTGVNGADGDLDGDGDSNIAEMIAGTAANDPLSTFRMTSIESDPGSMLLRWTSVPGKRYRIHLSDNLQSWAPLMDGGVALVLDAAPGATTSHLAPMSNPQREFARVEVLDE